MILTIKNLGALKEAEIDLSKDLILLCGHNNTGKTYVAYAIYYVLQSKLAYHLDMVIESLYDISFERNMMLSPITKKIDNEKIIELANELIQSKKIDIDFADLIKDAVLNLKNDIAKSLKKEIITENSEDNFFDKEIDFNLTYTENFIRDNLYKSEANRQVYLMGGIKEIKKKNSSVVRFELSEDLSLDLVANAIYLSLLHNCLRFSFSTKIFSSERAAINIFSKELALNKNHFLDIVLKSKKEDRLKLLEFGEENINRYQKPIADELNIAEDLLYLQRQKSEFEFLAIELEKSILEGKISVGQYGGLQYQPNFYNENKNGKEENVILEIYQTSSLVKSLASLVFYLRHLAKKNDCIIIDEPELNLHPDNQILVARFLARLVNEGFKVVASTHSDYIIKELSTLLLLSDSFKQKDRIMEKYGYTQNQILNKENVGVYYFEKGKNTAVNVPITERGIEIESIDQAISDLNERFDTIYYTEDDDE